MRTTILVLASLLIVSPAVAQQIHQATPVEVLVERYLAEHPDARNHGHHAMHDEAGAGTELKAAVSDVDLAATKAFTITAQQFDFSVNPAPFVVNVGDTVTIDLTSADVTHGFAIEHYFENGTSVNKNQHRTVTFVANQAGTFTYFCIVFCGEGHFSMSGTLTVQAGATAPTITSIAPTSGVTVGGTVVTITGTGFQNGATVKFGDTPAIGVTITNATSISVLSPAHDAGPVSITVTNPDGGSVTSATFTYQNPGKKRRAVKRG